MNVVKIVWRWAVKKAPAILTYTAAGGLIGSVILSAEAGKKCEKAMFQAKVDKADQTGVVDKIIEEGEYTEEQVDDPLVNRDILERAASQVKLTFGEKCKVYFKSFWGVGLMTGGTLACMLSGLHIGTKRLSLAAATLGATQQTLQSYKDEVKEFFGEKQAKELDHEINKKMVKESPPTEENTGKIYHGGRVWICDPLTGQYIVSNIETFRSQVNDLNNVLNRDKWVSKNDFYFKTGFKEVKGGDQFGWALDNWDDYDPHDDYPKRRVRRDCLIKIDFDWQPKPDDLPWRPDIDPNMPIAVIDYCNNLPTAKYSLM